MKYLWIFITGQGMLKGFMVLAGMAVYPQDERSSVELIVRLSILGLLFILFLPFMLLLINFLGARWHYDLDQTANNVVEYEKQKWANREGIYENDPDANWTEIAENKAEEVKKFWIREASIWNDINIENIKPKKENLSAKDPK